MKGSLPIRKRKYPKSVGVCLICKNEIIAKSKALDRNRKFCGAECFIKSRIGKPRPTCKLVTFKCLSCQTLFSDYQGDKRKFCSHECFWKYNIGINNQNWKEIKSPSSKDRKLLMKRTEYRFWRLAVFNRDKWTCIQCGMEDVNKIGKGLIIHADHIKSWGEYPELRYTIDNGRTLCIDCHKKTDTWGKSLNVSGILTAET